VAAAVVAPLGCFSTSVFHNMPGTLPSFFFFALPNLCKQPSKSITSHWDTSSVVRLPHGRLPPAAVSADDDGGPNTGELIPCATEVGGTGGRGNPALPDHWKPLLGSKWILYDQTNPSTATRLVPCQWRITVGGISFYALRPVWPPIRARDA